MANVPAVFRDIKIKAGYNFRIMSGKVYNKHIIIIYIYQVKTMMRVSTCSMEVTVKGIL